jgi:membrane protein required for colicin V production
LTLFDYLVLFVMVCSVIIGTVRGLVREVFSLLGWIVAFFVGSTYCDALAVMLPEVIPGASVRLIVAFFLLFFGVKLLVSLLTRTIDAIVKTTGLTVVDRSLGSFFGFARGAVIILSAVLVCGMTAIPQQGFWRNASTSGLAEEAAQHLLPFLPSELARYVKF